MRMSATIRRRPSPTDEGQDWLYWEPRASAWRRVELTAVPSETPQRARVQHLDADRGARAEWVPSGRLHVPWQLRDEYLASVEAGYLMDTFTHMRVARAGYIRYAADVTLRGQIKTILDKYTP